MYHLFDFRRIVDLLDAYGYECYIDSAKGGPGMSGVESYGKGVKCERGSGMDGKEIDTYSHP